ncbi:MAG: hypothetical protein WBY44_34690 [Bryobacteraceae bacterium]
MAIGEFTKQIAQQALLSATSAPKEAPAAPADPTASAIVAQIAAMQKQLKDDEELVVAFHQGSERIRVVEIYVPAPQVVVLIGLDATRALTRVISAPAALQLICKTAKAAPGAKAIRVALVNRKQNDSSA